MQEFYYNQKDISQLWDAVGSQNAGQVGVIGLQKAKFEESLKNAYATYKKANQIKNETMITIDVDLALSELENTVVLCHYLSPTTDKENSPILSVKYEKEGKEKLLGIPGITYKF